MVIILYCFDTDRGSVSFGILFYLYGFLSILPCNIDSAGSHIITALFISSESMSQLVITLFSTMLIYLVVDDQYNMD